MPLSDEFLEKWEHIIDSVDKTEVPIECIKKVAIKLDGGRRRYLNMKTLRKQGLDIEEIEAMLNQVLADYGERVKGIDFFVDVESVAEIIQPETDKILNNLS